MNLKFICDKLNKTIVVNKVANPPKYHTVGSSKLFRLAGTTE